MPARIRIVRGPDQGAETTLNTGEVRIGRGAGCQFQVKDEGFNGQLRVYYQGGTYYVSNETEKDGWVIAFNPQKQKYESVPFPRNTKRVWDHGYQIQPSANTTLELHVVEAEPGAGDDEGDTGGRVVVTRTRTAGEDKKARDKLYLIITVLTGPLAVLLFLQPSGESGPPAPTRTQVSKRFDTVSKDLEDLKGHPKYSRSAMMVRGYIRDARLDEVSDRVTDAYDGYQQARDELDRALGDRPTDDRRPDAASPPPADDDPAVTVLRAAREFTAERLVILARTKPSRSR